MKLQYKRVDTKTIKGIKQAERLQANGWKAINVGLTYILYEKRTAKEKRVANPFDACKFAEN